VTALGTPARIDDAGGRAETPPSRSSIMARLRVGQWVTIVVGLLAIVLVASVIVGGTALRRESDARKEIIEQLDPVRTASLELSSAIVAQQNAVRGYVLNGLELNLDAYERAHATQMRVTEQIQRLAAGSPALTRRVTDVRTNMEAWRDEFASAGIERVRREGPGARSNPARARLAAARFTEVTGAVAGLGRDIAARRADAQDRLDASSRSMAISFYVIAGVLALALLGVWITMRRAIGRPLERLAAHARIVARGDLEHRLAGEGPADVVGLANDVDSMRLRILADLEDVRTSRERLEAQAHELETKARDLERSNAELEQFAYVASHDLQEPLRKVASFCQLLQRRYEGQLDERADQYIGFAVDGAKRMQSLITDLLAFSRVGRTETELVDTPLDEVVATAVANLTRRTDESGARVEVDPMPVVLGERVLLTAVFQNLIGNALKFHGDEPPVVRVTAERTGPDWTISCRDEGIGIDPEYAERIFAIFQRLHPKETYEGTGIGLALCRKIVEFHGGQIWLDTDATPGTTFRFTLPALPA
jgi:signal transduction histidine kinase